MITDFDTYSDEELVGLIHDGESQVTDFLMEKYKNLVRSKAGTMFILGADKEDLIQEGMIGLYKAIRDFDPGRDASFITFADLCVSRQIYTAVKNSGRKKHSPLNAYVSFYSSESDESGDDRKLIENLIAADSADPEVLAISRENEEKIYDTIDAVLSEFEKSVMELYIAGLATVEIAKILGKDAKATGNAIQRAKGKLKKALGEVIG